MISEIISTHNPYVIMIIMSSNYKLANNEYVNNFSSGNHTSNNLKKCMKVSYEDVL